MTPSPAICVTDLSFRYGDREALKNVRFDVSAGEIFAILGPNGGGKSTLFRLLSTLISLQSGTIRVFGHDVASERLIVRQNMGVVFQSPSLDRKLTVSENMLSQAALYGIVGKAARQRTQELLDLFGLADRAGEFAERLSGGQRRRVEIAKSMIHAPRLLLMDEPSTGLDPGVRRELANTLDSLRSDGITIVLTTHLLEEAARADRLAILDQGEIVALDTPHALQESIGGEVLSISCDKPEWLRDEILAQMQLNVSIIDGRLRLEVPQAGELVAGLMRQFGDDITAITVGRPTLEDVFVAKTGRSLAE